MQDEPDWLIHLSVTQQREYERACRYHMRMQGIEALFLWCLSVLFTLGCVAAFVWFCIWMAK